MKKPFLASAVLVSVLLPAVVNAESDKSRINRERKAIGRALVEVQSTNWPLIVEYYTDDIEYHDPIVTIQGIDMMSQFLARMFTSSPDLITLVEDEVCVNDMYAATWTMLGKFNGVPYTAKGMSIIKFLPKKTQVYYQRDYYTEGDIMINIPGLDEPTAAFRYYYRCAVDPTFSCPSGPAMSDDVPQAPETGAGDALSPNMPPSRRTNVESDMSRINRERKAIGRALVEVQATNWPFLVEYYTDDVEYRDPIVTILGIDTMSQFLARMFASSPNLITVVEDEICIDGIYAATWTMAGAFNGVPYSAKGMSVIKFRPKETQVYYQRDYYTEGDIMINIPGLSDLVAAFRSYYRCAVDPTFPCP
jgi:hypothetical protein